ncbi:RAMP superfamily CRISPR-associated protein [Rhodovulum sp. YEN HP10]|uniref:RAMP superfamily CRISPR-associated protein n=1 Tax=Rhodovulum sp. HP10 TaxID=3387397 RepID=UPI0039E10E53
MTAPGFYRFPLALGLEAPFLIAGSTPSAYGLDVAQIRNADGRAIIPDSHIRGVVRHAWAALESDGCEIPATTESLFGAEGTDTDPIAGAISFSDLIAVEDGKLLRSTRVAIDEETGAARDGHLIVVEQIAKIGEVVNFRGNLTMFLGEDEDAGEYRDALQRALDLVLSVGRFKTVGFGRVVQPSVGSAEKIGLTQGDPVDGMRVSSAFRLDRRLLVDIVRRDANTLASSEVISGAAIKGTLARQMELFGEDIQNGPVAKALSRMRVSHAFPFGGGLGRSSNRLDAVRFEQSASGKRYLSSWPMGSAPHPTTEKAVPRFRVDWKDEDLPQEPVTLSLRRDLRIRTAINSESGAAADGKLFAESSVLPVIESGEPVVWRGEVSLSANAGPEVRNGFRICLDHFRSGLFLLGKTRAQTEAIEFSLASPAPVPSSNGGVFTVVLKTPALMLREIHLSSEMCFAEALQLYWERASNGALRIATEEECRSAENRHDAAFNDPEQLEFFAQVELRGGFQAVRHRFFGSEVVEPFVLCKPGSVFKLIAQDEAAGVAALSGFLEMGLPVAFWAERDELETGYDFDFNECPFLPQNGFGAIELDMEGGAA